MQFALDFLPPATVLRAFEGALEITIPFGSNASSPAKNTNEHANAQSDEQSLVLAVSRDKKGGWQLSKKPASTAGTAKTEGTVNDASTTGTAETTDTANATDSTSAATIVLRDAGNRLPSRLDSYRNALSRAFSNGDISASDLAVATQDFAGSSTLNKLTPELFAATIILVLARFAIADNSATNPAAAEAKSVSAMKPKGKAQHRFRKELANIAFYVDDFGAKATIYWQKRNEMRILAGAQLRQDVPLRKDGEIGLNGRFGNTLREENADKIKDFTVVEDIVVRSVNEVGLLLYYGDTNSWLVLRDANGKTIDEYSRV